MKNKIKNLKYDGGQAMLTGVIFFLFISSTIVLGIANPILKQVKISQDIIHSKQSYFSAEGGLEDALYRVKNGKTIASGNDISIGGYNTTISLTTTSNGKTVDAVSNWNGIVRKMESSVVTGGGIAFNYGLQAGNGGVNLSGSAKINGNIYSNSSIIAVSSTITGSAVAADSTSLTPDQTNDSPTVPPSSVTFRNLSATQDIAESFQVSSPSLLNNFQFYIKKVGSPSDITVRLVADNSGSPSTTVIPIGSVTLSAGQVTTSYGWVQVVLPSPQQSLIPGTTYWIVLDSSSQSSSNYYVIGANTSYSLGTAKTGSYGGSWTATNLDAYFRLYTGGITSYIGGAGYVGGVTIGGDAWATSVQGASVTGNLYCTTGANNNKSCNTSHGTPSPQPLPFSDSNIQSWKDDATSGGTITGDYTVGYAGATLGPKKITGNLTVNGGGTLTLSGTIWVQGTVTISNGGKIVLPANFGKNSGTLISDGVMTISGGGSAGSGTSGSYLFVVSTSKCPDDVGCGTNSAINITGGAGAIAANAQNGNVDLSGGASIDAVVGNSISASGGATVTYDSGLASPSFQSGPSGGWDISTWKEVQ